MKFTEILLSAGLLVSCKPVQQPASSPSSSSAGDEEGVIDIPKELVSSTSFTEQPSASSPSRLSSGLNNPKEMTPGSKLSIKVRGTNELALELIAPLSGKSLEFQVEGAAQKTLLLAQDQMQFQINVPTTGTHTLLVTLPQSSNHSVKISNISSSDGEILEWKILPPLN